MKIKLEMVGLGWDVQTKITGEGWRDNIGYMIWFRRSDWHGKFTYTITGRDVVFFDTTKNVYDYNAVIETVRKTADKAKKAWDDFPDSIPCQNAKGDVIQDVMHCSFHNGKDIKDVDENNKRRFIRGDT